jgi:hypothetical protein
MSIFFYDNFSDHFLLNTKYKRKNEINPLGAFPSLPHNNLSRLIIDKRIKILSFLSFPCNKVCVESCYLNSQGISFRINQTGEVPLLIYSFDKDIDFSLVKNFYAYVQIFNWFLSLRIVLLDKDQNILSIFQNINIPLFRKILKIDFVRTDNNPLTNVRFIKIEVITNSKMKIDIFFIGASYKNIFYDNFTFIQSLANGFLNTIEITDNSSSSNNRTLSLVNTGSLNIFSNSDPYNHIFNSPAGLSFYVTVNASILYKNVNILPGNHILHIPLFVIRLVANSFSIIADDGSGNILGSTNINSNGFSFITIPINNTSLINNLRIIIQNNNSINIDSSIFFQANPTFPTFLLNTNTLSLGLIEGIIFYILLL